MACSAAAVRYVEHGASAAAVSRPHRRSWGGGQIRLTRHRQTDNHREPSRRPPDAGSETDAKDRLFAADSSVELTQANYKPLYNAKQALMRRAPTSLRRQAVRQQSRLVGFGTGVGDHVLVLTGLLIAATFADSQSGRDTDHGVRHAIGRDHPGGDNDPSRAAKPEIVDPANYLRGDLDRPVCARRPRLRGYCRARANRLRSLIATYILGPLALLGFRWLAGADDHPEPRSVLDRIEGFRLISSALPRKISSTHSIHQPRTQNCSSGFSRTPSRSMSKLPGRRALPPYLRLQEPSASICGLVPRQSMEERSGCLHAMGWAAPRRKPSSSASSPPSSDGGSGAAARPEAGVVAAAGRGGEHCQEARLIRTQA